MNRPGNARVAMLAIDGDAAGESAALRGMELAVKQGFEVNVVALEPGIDPADDPAGFEGKLADAEPYVVYRVKVEMDRAENREAAFRKAKAILDGYPEGPDKLAAQRLVTDRVGTTVQFRTGAIPSARAAAAPRIVDAGRASSGVRSPVHSPTSRCGRSWPSSRPSTSTIPAPRASRPPRRRDAARRRRPRLRRRAPCPRRDRGDRCRATGEELLGGSASASCGASCRRQGPSGRRSCR